MFFDNNTGEKGSGLLITCENTCLNNAINISSSQFKNNGVFKIQTKSNNQGGAGLTLIIGGDQSGLPDRNNFRLHNCNNAWFGGLFASRIVQYITNCTR